MDFFGGPSVFRVPRPTTIFNEEQAVDSKKLNYQELLKKYNILYTKLEQSNIDLTGVKHPANFATLGVI